MDHLVEDFLEEYHRDFQEEYHQDYLEEHLGLLVEAEAADQPQAAQLPTIPAEILVSSLQ